MTEAVRRSYNPWHLWVIGIIWLFFASLGLRDFYMVASQNHGYIESLYGRNGIAYFTDYPWPLLALFFVNVTCGAAAAIVAFFDKQQASKLALASAVTGLLLIVATVAFRDRINALGPRMILQDTAVMLATFGLYFYYRRLGQNRTR